MPGSIPGPGDTAVEERDRSLHHGAYVLRGCHREAGRDWARSMPRFYVIYDTASFMVALRRKNEHPKEPGTSWDFLSTQQG